MASFANLSREERIGLGIAAVLHVALVAALMWQVRGQPAKLPVPERITVSLADDVALTSTAPKPAAAAQAAIAPELAPEPAPPPPVPAPEPIPTVQVKEQPKSALAPLHQPPPKPAPAPKASAAPAPPKLTLPPKPAAKAGGSRLGSDFLAGVSAGERTKATTAAPAAAFGAAEAASLSQAIARQLKPHWSAPAGVDVEKLVAIVRFRLNPDGSLNGMPTLVSETGVTPSNEAQKDRYVEQAVRAIRLAAPFELPAELYSHWKMVNSQFDRRL